MPQGAREDGAGEVAARTAADGGAHHLALAVHRPPIEAGHGTGVAVRQRQLPGALIGPHPALRQHSASVRTGRFPSQVVRVPGSRLLCPRKGAGRSSADGVPSAGGSGRRRTRPPQSGGAPRVGRLRLPRDWGAEQTDTPAEIINHALAHLEGSATIRADGGETVADPIMATDPDGDPVFHSLARAGDSRDYAFFDISTSTGALTVSSIGADDDVGLGIGLYDLGVVASDGGPVRGEVGVTIQVKARTAPLGDGVCP